MSDTRISPVKVATAAVVGAVATEAAVLTKNYAAKKIAALPTDTFIKKTATSIGNGWTSLKTAITSRINRQTISSAWGWIKGKLGGAKDAVVSGLSRAKSYVSTKAAELAAKPAMKKVLGFVKKPMVIGAVLGVVAFVGISKLLDKINNK